MSAKPNDLESSSTPGSEGESQTPETSKKNDSLTSDLSPAELWKRLEPFAKPAFQSVKDSRIGKLERTLEGIQPVLDKVKGLIPADQYAALQRDLEFDAMKARLFGDQTETQSSDLKTVGTEKGNAATEVTSVVDEVLSLPGNDPRVTNLKLQYGNDPKGYLSAALQLYAQIGNKQESTPGEQPAPAGGAPVRKVENPIANIDDPNELYALASKKLREDIASGKKRKVAS